MIKFTITDDSGNEVEHMLPSKREVCSRCDGEGSHLTPSIGEHAYSQEEFEESFSTDEEKEDYFKRGGIYDVACEVCDGENVEDVVDEEHCDPVLLKAYHKQQADEYSDYMERAAERRMGC